MASTDPILDLSTLIPDRPRIRIDRRDYHLYSPDELSLAQSLKFTRWGKELEELGRQPDKLPELEALLATVARAALADVPDDVCAKLSSAHRLSIVELFTMLLLRQKARVAGAVVGSVLSTGQKPSRAFSTSLVALLAGGLMKRRQRSSVRT